MKIKFPCLLRAGARARFKTFDDADRANGIRLYNPDYRVGVNGIYPLENKDLVV